MRCVMVVQIEILQAVPAEFGHFDILSDNEVIIVGDALISLFVLIYDVCLCYCYDTVPFLPPRRFVKA